MDTDLEASVKTALSGILNESYLGVNSRYQYHLPSGAREEHYDPNSQRPGAPAY